MDYGTIGLVADVHMSNRSTRNDDVVMPEDVFLFLVDLPTGAQDAKGYGLRGCLLERRVEIVCESWTRG